MINLFFYILLMVVPLGAFADDYPTHERVYYVLNCFDNIGRYSWDDLHTCSCRIDSIASEISFESYSIATTYERHRRMPGKQGGVFRSNESAKEKSDKLVKAQRNAENKCKKVVQLTAPTDLTKDQRYNDIQPVHSINK